MVSSNRSLQSRWTSYNSLVNNNCFFFFLFVLNNHGVSKLSNCYFNFLCRKPCHYIQIKTYQLPAWVLQVQWLPAHSLCPQLPLHNCPPDLLLFFSVPLLSHQTWWKIEVKKKERKMNILCLYLIFLVLLPPLRKLRNSSTINFFLWGNLCVFPEGCVLLMCSRHFSSSW